MTLAEKKSSIFLRAEASVKNRIGTQKSYIDSLSSSPPGGKKNDYFLHRRGHLLYYTIIYEHIVIKL